MQSRSLRHSKCIFTYRVPLGLHGAVKLWRRCTIGRAPLGDSIFKNSQKFKLCAMSSATSKRNYYKAQICTFSACNSHSKWFQHCEKNKKNTHWSKKVNVLKTIMWSDANPREDLFQHLLRAWISDVYFPKQKENHGNFEYYGRQKYERKALFPVFLS